MEQNRLEEYNRAEEEFYKEKEKGVSAMKATGIVRRIDDLGRIVIPREVRRNLRIKEGDPLEILVGGDGEVIFKKYSELKSLSNIAESAARTLHQVLHRSIIIVDRLGDVLTSSGSIKENGLKQANAILDIFNTIKAGKFINKTIDNKDYMLFPIPSSGEIIGIIIISAEILTDVEKEIISSMSKLISLEIER